MRCLKETNRLVRELMAGNLSNKAIGRVQTVAAAENRGFRGLNIGGKTYKPKRMLRDLGTMNAGVERGNAALMQKHDVHYINADKETPAKELFQGGTQTTGGALAAQGKPLRAMFRKVRRTAVDESPEVAAGIGDALKELPQNKRHYIIHSPATTQKWAGKNSDPLIKRHEVNEIEAIDRNPAQAKVEEWKTGTRPVAGGHQHPVVLAKEMNLARRLNVHGLDIGGMKRMRRWSGEATALKSITGKTYGKQVLSNRELRNVAKLKPSKVVGGERWDLTGRKDRINRAVDEVAKAQPEFKRGEAKLVDWTKKLQNSNSSIGDYAKLTPPIGSKLSNTVRRPLTAKRLQDKARKEFHEALVGRSNLKEGNMKLHEMRRFMSRVGLCELRAGPTADAVMAAARAREAPKGRGGGGR